MKYILSFLLSIFFTSSVFYAQQLTVEFPSTSEAKTYIVQDSFEQYFDQIGILDMQLQLQDESETDRTKLLNNFKQILQSTVLEFSSTEKEKLSEIFSAIDARCTRQKIADANKTIQLIKIKNQLYGPSVFYTRGNAIIIPEDVFESMSYEQLSDVMIHELWHVIARLNPSLAERVYKVIHFEKINTNIDIPVTLLTKKLINPDGINIHWKINVGTNEPKYIIPIIYSKSDKLIETKKAFFDYLEFELFELEETSSGHRVLATARGNSTLEETIFEDFFKKIGSNTNYIIHPDEISADIFIKILMDRKSENEYDQKIVDDIKKIIVE